VEAENGFETSVPLHRWSSVALSGGGRVRRGPAAAIGSPGPPIVCVDAPILRHAWGMAKTSSILDGATSASGGVPFRPSRRGFQIVGRSDCRRAKAK